MQKNNSAENINDNLLSAKTNDMLHLCIKTYSPKYSAFLDERQCTFVSQILRKQDDCDFFFWGGYENAQRKMLCVCDFNNKPDYSEMPIDCITFKYRTEDKLSHRDFLGAVMACQIKRESVGDIVVADGITQLFIINSLTEFIMNNITKVGNVGVSISANTTFCLKRTDCFQEIHGTVASLRLDCVASLVANISREKISAVIKNTGIDVNYIPIYSPSFMLNEGDIFSIRGYGKFILDEVSGISKKADCI